mmetsp:Transcript_7811/g.17382  ORF Transcript_7811/g.17382 Transcript_7811/m.17382 type:complete len:139 (+) Transcript_7811:1317-1733(+)
MGWMSPLPVYVPRVPSPTSNFQYLGAMPTIDTRNSFNVQRLNNIPMFEQGEGGTTQTSKEQAQSKLMQLKQSLNELSSFPVASVSAAYDDRELSSNKRTILMDRRATAHAGCGCGIVGNNDNRNTYKVRTAITLLELN